MMLVQYCWDCGPQPRRFQEAYRYAHSGPIPAGMKLRKVRIRYELLGNIEEENR